VSTAADPLMPGRQTFDLSSVSRVGTPIDQRLARYIVPMLEALNLDGTELENVLESIIADHPHISVLGKESKADPIGNRTFHSHRILPPSDRVKLQPVSRPSFTLASLFPSRHSRRCHSTIQFAYDAAGNGYIVIHFYEDLHYREKPCLHLQSNITADIRGFVVQPPVVQSNWTHHGEGWRLFLCPMTKISEAVCSCLPCALRRHLTEGLEHLRS
jgi:hypothetical protein